MDFKAYKLVNALIKEQSLLMRKVESLEEKMALVLDTQVVVDSLQRPAATPAKHTYDIETRLTILEDGFDWFIDVLEAGNKLDEVE